MEAAAPATHIGGTIRNIKCFTADAANKIGAKSGSSKIGIVAAKIVIIVFE
jgi:hypothetical protein